MTDPTWGRAGGGGYFTPSDRRSQHPPKYLAAFTGILQADCYNGFEPLFGAAALKWKLLRRADNPTDQQTA